MVDVQDINDRLESAFQKVNTRDPVTAKQFLDSYLSLLALFAVDVRLQAFKAAIEFSKDDVPTSVYNISLLRAAVANFFTDDVDFVEALANFGKRNPREGRRFIEYANGIMPNFNAEVRRAALGTLVNSYYNYFNDIAKQEEATNLFICMLSEFVAEQQVKALGGILPSLSRRLLWAA